MARFLVNLNNGTIEDIFENLEDFTEKLLSIAPPKYADLIKPGNITDDNFIYAYNIILNHYKTNRFLGLQRNFETNFIMTFLNYYPAYLNDFNLDFSLKTETKNIGSTDFSGETPSKDNGVFETPAHSNKFSFKQKSGQELRDEILTRTFNVEKWCNEFKDLFYTDIGE